MGTTNEKATARSTQAKTKSDDISRRHGATGCESKSSRSQQERNDRENSSQSSIFSPGTRVTGGMLDHLISEYQDQVAIKKAVILHTQTEIERLEIRIKEFEALREELNKESHQQDS